jgi:sirohydrochlorin cobaltochelatase
MRMMNADHAILLFAHGARDPRWAQPFEAVAQAVRLQRPGVAVRLAFLEFMTPSLIDAAESLLADGAKQISVVPLFLGAGGHVRKDLPGLLDELRTRHPHAHFTLETAIGERQSVIEAMATAAAQGNTPP